MPPLEAEAEKAYESENEWKRKEERRGEVFVCVCRISAAFPHSIFATYPSISHMRLVFFWFPTLNILQTL